MEEKKYTVVVNAEGDIDWRDGAGNYHCEHGPACQWKNGSYAYYIHGKCHREGGPASLDIRDGRYYYSYYLDDINYGEAEYYAELAKRKGHKPRLDGEKIELNGQVYTIRSA